MGIRDILIFRSSSQSFYMPVSLACLSAILVNGFNSQMRQFPSEYFVQYCHYYLSSLLHRYFCKMTQIFAFAPFNSKYVKQVSSKDPPSSPLFNNLKLQPFFQWALGPIDGSHIHATTCAEHHKTCCNWKGFISQNCLFCCSFDLLFSYVLTGWEGSASDA
jgi:hypothetical protein